MKIDYFYATTIDLNGILRGKRYPTPKKESIINNGIKMPISVFGLDVFGNDLRDSQSTVLQNGDADGFFVSTKKCYTSIHADNRYFQYVPFDAFDLDEKPYLVDPRQLLKVLLQQFHERKLKIVCAIELEFFLYKNKENHSKEQNEILSVAELKKLNTFFDDLYALCELNQIQVTAASSENGQGQFEINVAHSDQILDMVDDLFFLKQLVKDSAKKHGLNATFMAKPYSEISGNGMHVHASLYDEQGQNVFLETAKTHSQQLLFAIGGLLDSMIGSSLVFAPNFNSYKRLNFGCLSPTEVAWGVENRTAAIRIVDQASSSCRIEHRLPGADSNPYLVLCYIFAAILYGMDQKIIPPDAQKGNIYAMQNLQKIPTDWHSALSNFIASNQLKDYIPSASKTIFTALKQQEIQFFARTVSPFEFDLYSTNF